MKIIRFAKALADPIRARLLALLARFELNVGELVAILGLKQSRVSNNLRLLAECGLVHPRRDGSWVYYRASQQDEPGRFLESILPLLAETPEVTADQAAAERLVAERSRENRRFFDALAGQWQNLAAEILTGFDLAREVERLLPPCRVAADLGCGPGELLPVLARRCRLVIAVDQAPNMLGLAQQRCGDSPNFQYRLGELERPPLLPGEADLILLSLALHHVAEPREGLHRAADLLAPTGHLLLVEFERHDDESLRRRHGDRWLGFTTEELRVWLLSAGLAVPRVERRPLASGFTLLFCLAQKPAASWPPLHAHR